MAITLGKQDHTHAVVPFGDLIFRGKIVKRHHRSVTIKVDSCTGRTGADYDMVGAILRFTITPEVDLYR